MLTYILFFCFFFCLEAMQFNPLNRKGYLGTQRNHSIRYNQVEKREIIQASYTIQLTPDICMEGVQMLIYENAVYSGWVDYYHKTSSTTTWVYTRDLQSQQACEKFIDAKQKLSVSQVPTP